MSDYETAQKRRSMIVGIFVVIAFLAFGWMIFHFGDLPILVSEIRSYEVKVQFPSAPGVQRDTPVRFCGYQIGKVTHVKPPDTIKDLKTGEYYHQTVVILSIDNKFDNIPAAVEIKLMTRGLGSSYIELKVPPMDIRDGNVLHEGSLRQGSTGMTSEFFPEESQQKLADLIDGIGGFVKNANDIFGDPNNKANLKSALSDLAAATKQATDVMKELSQLASAGKQTLSNADKRMEEVVVAMVGTSEKMSEVMTQLHQILEKVNNGDGAVARVINDGRLYEDLLENSQQLKMVLEDLQVFVAESREKGVPIKLK